MRYALVTGGSRGLGRAICLKLAQQGYPVIINYKSNSEAALETRRLVEEQGGQAELLPFDVSDREQVEKALEDWTQRHQEDYIAVLVNNAGYGELGPIETTSLDNAQRQLDVNVVGLVRMTRLVLPHMREQGRGRIVNVASVAGRITFGFAGWYNASKYAVEALSDATRMEVRPYGIDVAIIEPGGVYSNWGRIAAEQLRKASEKTVYQEKAGRMANVFEMMYGRNPYNLMTSATQAAKHVCKAATTRHPKTRYAFGVGNASMRFLHTVLPDRWFDGIITWLFSTFG